MAADLVLLTGCTGLVGYRTLIKSLAAGYRVRAVVRQDAAVDTIKASKSIQPYLSKVHFLVVADITKRGAFENALKDVDYIIHIASPFPKPSEDLEKDLVKPAVEGTLSILHSALQQPTIRRIVITSSCLAVFPLSIFEGIDPGVLSPDSHLADPKGPYANHLVAYTAGKILAFNATAKFIEQQKPDFTVINVLPSFVIGKNELATTREAVNSGSNAVALTPVLGGQNPAGMLSLSVHLEDVAHIHVAALDSRIEGNRNFGANVNGLEGIQWDDAIGIVERNFPEQVKGGLFPLGGSQASNLVRFDARETERVFGLKFKSFEEQIISLAGWYAEVSANK